jgi:hypothetical protein
MEAREVEMGGEKKVRRGEEGCDRLRGRSVDRDVSIRGGVPHVPLGPRQPRCPYAAYCFSFFFLNSHYFMFVGSKLIHTTKSFQKKLQKNGNRV